MKRTAMLLSLILVACDTATEPVLPETQAPDPELALVASGTPYPEVDQQLQRLYHLNNCLSGLYPYNANPNCQKADVTYDAATLLNWSLASIFDDGVTVTKGQAQWALWVYLWAIEEAYERNRMTCRARYATNKLALELLGIVNGINPPSPADVSSMPQPLSAPLEDLDPFAGSGCPAEDPPLPVLGASGYSIFATNTSCSDGGTSINVIGDEPYFMQSTRSNASLRVSADDGWFDGTTSYRCNTANLTGSSNTEFWDGPNKVTSVYAAPISYDAGDFPCTYSRSGNFNIDAAGSHWVGGNSSSRKLNPGVYCANGGNLTLTLDDVVGTVTFRATGTINIGGSGGGDLNTFRPYLNDVVAYSASGSSAAITVNGDLHSFAGHLYAPAGRVNIGGDYFHLNGTIVAGTVSITGQQVSIFGRNP